MTTRKRAIVVVSIGLVLLMAILSYGCWRGLEKAKTLTDIVVGVVTCVGIAAAVWQYFDAQAVRRGEWLHKLFQAFYESPAYRQIRDKLDSQVEPTKSVEAELCDELEPQFVDYLNFFEFIAALRELNQVQKEEVRTLFNYWLTQLAAAQWVVKYVEKYDFENLGRLLQENKPDPSRQ